jgi:hypothetical protein
MANEAADRVRALLLSVPKRSDFSDEGSYEIARLRHEIDLKFSKEMQAKCEGMLREMTPSLRTEYNQKYLRSMKKLGFQSTFKTREGAIKGKAAYEAFLAKQQQKSSPFAY